jgi:hypothetical protein
MGAIVNAGRYTNVRKWKSESAMISGALKAFSAFPIQLVQKFYLCFFEEFLRLWAI